MSEQNCDKFYFMEGRDIFGLSITWKKKYCQHSKDSDTEGGLIRTIRHFEGCYGRIETIFLVHREEAVVRSRSSMTGSVWLDAHGTFQTQQTYITGADPLSVTVGDFNGDGKPDLAVANSADNTVSVLLGNGDGSFQTQQVYATGGVDPISMVMGDFNGDGKPDLAVINAGDTSRGEFDTNSSVSVLLNAGGSTATATATGISFPIGSGDHLVEASYDGNTDYAASFTSSPNRHSRK